MSEADKPLSAPELDMLSQLKGPDPLALAVRAVREIQRRRMSTPQSNDELRRKLAAAHAEIERRRRRDVEIAAHVPLIAARLQVIAEDVKRDAAESNAEWWRDPEIDWTGIER